VSAPSTVPASRDAGRPVRAALATALALAVIAGVVVAVVLLRGGSQGRPAAQPATAESPALAPPSVVSRGFAGLALAAHRGDVLVGVGAYAGGPLDVVVVPSDESEIRTADVRLDLRGRSLPGAAARTCGSGCFRFALGVLAGRPANVVVEVARPGRATVRVPVGLPARMPAQADALLRRARAAMLGLRALGMDETLGAGLAKPVVSRWSFQAPDRMSYSIRGGAKAVVVGTRRWDDFGSGWRRSAIPRLEVPTFPWVRARAARLLGSARLDGRRVQVVAALLPAAAQEAPIWFELDVRQDGRVLRSRMLTTAHFMTDTYRRFGSVPRIRPPK
jgi:hypothetical protein